MHKVQPRSIYFRLCENALDLRLVENLIPDSPVYQRTQRLPFYRRTIVRPRRSVKTNSGAGNKRRCHEER